MSGRRQGELSLLPTGVSFVVISAGGRDEGVAAAMRSVNLLAPNAQRIVVFQRCPAPGDLPDEGWEVLFDDRTGVSSARNRAMSVVDREWVQFLDDDAELTPWWEQLDDDRPLRSREWSAVAFRMIDPVSGESLHPFPEVAQPVTTRNLFGCMVEPRLVLRVASLRSVGGFDERLGVGTFFGADEGSDLSFRLLRAGHTMYYHPAIGAHHPTAGNAVVPAKKRRYGRGTGHLLWLYPGEPSVWFYVVGSIAAPIVRPYRRGMSRGRFLGRWARALGVVEGFAASPFREGRRPLRPPNPSGGVA